MKSQVIESYNASFKDDVPRRSANFQPSAWGDYFLSFHSNALEEDNVVMEQLQQLKEEVRSMLAAAGKSLEKLSLIDSIQRLGLSYHFEEEINETLYHIQNPCNVDNDDGIYFTALRFRFLRQQGYSIPCEIFNKFVNEKGEFKESIVKDEGGILSLYEASYLRMHGENILDEALTFTTTHLQAMAMDSSSRFADDAKYALKWPIYKAFPRLMARHYISLYDNHPLNNDVLLAFARLDYNNLQKLYQKELGEISRWWKDLKMIEHLSFPRDRVVECYVWALGVYYEPKYSIARRIFTKIITFLSVLDDMYDLYATLDELELFTDAIERWDINDIEKLPNYMKIIYEAILEFYGEIEQYISKDDNNIPFAIDFTKKAMKRLCRAYYAEAKWFNGRYVPTVEEYMKVAIVSGACYLLTPISFIGLGVVPSKEAFQWLESEPMLLKAAAVIGRLMNDITSHKFEQERGHVASAVECYMKQYGTSEKETIVELEKQVVEAWKDIAEDYTKSSKFPNAILERVLNLARISNFFYKEEDGYTFANGATKRFITSLLVEPVLI